MVKVGVIGCGGLRGSLADMAHKPEEGFKVVAAADTDPKSIERFQENIGTDTFVTNDYRELLKQDIDAVFVITPDEFHEEHAVACLEAGKATYLEKPMGITIESCDRILQAAYENKTKLFIGHNMRHFPVILKMKELIDSGIIGPIQAVWCRHFVSYGGDAYFKDWHAERSKQLGLLLQKGAHDIYVIHWLAGGYTQRVVGMGKLSVYNEGIHRTEDEEFEGLKWSKDNWPPKATNHLNPKMDVEDHNMIMMQLDNGIQASYNQCFYSPDSGRNYTFIGTKGRIENLGDVGRCDITVYTNRTDTFGKPNMTVHMQPLAGGHGGSDPRIVSEFLHFVRDGIKTNTSPVAARYSVAAGVQATHSLREGNTPFDVPTLDPALIDYFESGQPGSK